MKARRESEPGILSMHGSYAFMGYPNRANLAITVVTPKIARARIMEGRRDE
jgi:hypothetical protein